MDFAQLFSVAQLANALALAIGVIIGGAVGKLVGSVVSDFIMPLVSLAMPAGDWRATYFVPENLHSSVDHAEALRPLVPDGMSMPEMALRFILSNPDVGTIIPGMRKVRHVEANIASSDGRGLNADLIRQLRAHRWDRVPTSWSQ